MKTLAICNQKGGVGKTTTAVNLSACLAREGRRVLLVDLDSQVNATQHIGKQSPKDEAKTSWELLANKRIDTRSCIYPHSLNFQYIPAHLALATVDFELQTAVGRENRMKRAFEQVSADFDYCVIDCPPSIGIATINAMTAADRAIICVQTNAFAFDAVKRLLRIVAEVKDELNPSLGFYALATMHRTNVTIHRDVLNALGELMPGLKLDSVIRFTATLAEAAASGKTIIEHAHGSNGHRDYEAFTKEVLKRVEQKEAISNSATRTKQG